MQGVTERNSLNWLFGISCTVFTLSSCVWGGSNSVSGEVIGVPLCRFPWIVVRISGSGCGFQMLMSSLQCCGIDEDNRRGLENFNFTVNVV